MTNHSLELELINILPVQNQLGEGIIWDHSRQCFWWTDILENTLYQYSPTQDQLNQWQTPERLCCFTPVANSDYLIAAFESGFAYYEPCTNQLQWIKKIESDLAYTRLNDGKVDRQGRFWAGSMVEDGSGRAQGRLYCVQQDLSVSTNMISELNISNSLCWSPDSKTLYHCDTPTRSIQQYDFDPISGDISNRHTLINTEEGCFPDGSAVDAAGYLWNAQWGASKVVRYDANGIVDGELQLPVSQATCVAFGGANLNLIAVTSARSELSDQALKQQRNAGDVFIFKSKIKGLMDTAFQPTEGNMPPQR